MLTRERLGLQLNGKIKYTLCNLTMVRRSDFINESWIQLIYRNLKNFSIIHHCKAKISQESHFLFKNLCLIESCTKLKSSLQERSTIRNWFNWKEKNILETFWIPCLKKMSKSKEIIYILIIVIIIVNLPKGINSKT